MSVAEIAASQQTASPGRGRLAGLTLGTLLCTVVLATVAFLVIYPVLLLLIHSFEIGPFGKPTGWGVENWVRAFTRPDLAGALWNTVTLAGARQAIALIVAVPICWLIARTDLP